jgi:hypothetical protein
MRPTTRSSQKTFDATSRFDKRVYLFFNEWLQVKFVETYEEVLKHVFEDESK